MKYLRVSLLGRFEVTWDGQQVAGFEHAKARELFSYLLLNRDKPNSRELIATYLWGNHYTTEISKKYLRKALWQLNEALSHCSREVQEDLIVADSNWLELRSIDSLWLDVSFVDEAYGIVKGTPGARLTVAAARILSDVAALYKGELLEGQYQEWSFYDVVRYRQIVLILLDKLMDHCLARGEYESVLEYGEQILRHDSARELTHLKLIYAYYVLGDRTGALRQYQRCADVLREELDVSPSHEAKTLFNQIRTDEAPDFSVVHAEMKAGFTHHNGSSFDLPAVAKSVTLEQHRRFLRLSAGA